MNAPNFEEAEDIDYLITNVEGENITPAMDSWDLFREKLGRSFLPLKQKVG